MFPRGAANFLVLADWMSGLGRKTQYAKNVERGHAGLSRVRSGISAALRGDKRRAVVGADARRRVL